MSMMKMSMMTMSIMTMTLMTLSFRFARRVWLLQRQREWQKVIDNQLSSSDATIS